MQISTLQFFRLWTSPISFIGQITAITLRLFVPWVCAHKVFRPFIFCILLSPSLPFALSNCWPTCVERSWVMQYVGELKWAKEEKSGNNHSKRIIFPRDQFHEEPTLVRGNGKAIAALRTPFNMNVTDVTVIASSRTIFAHTHIYLDQQLAYVSYSCRCHTLHDQQFGVWALFIQSNCTIWSQSFTLLIAHGRRYSDAHLKIEIRKITSERKLILTLVEPWK